MDREAMATYGSLLCIFEDPLPDNTPTLIESLSTWNPIELHVRETSQPSSSSSSSSSCSACSENEREERNVRTSPDSFSGVQKNNGYRPCHKSSDSSLSMNWDSLHLCTEGLGFESSDDVEDFQTEMNNGKQEKEGEVSVMKHPQKKNPSGGIFRRARTKREGGFPPPISCIRQSGKPWVWFKSYKQDGRFVLKEIRVQAKEVLRARREDGRLKLQFIQPDDKILEEEGEEKDGDLGDRDKTKGDEEGTSDAENDSGEEGDELRDDDRENLQ